MFVEFFTTKFCFFRFAFKISISFQLLYGCLASDKYDLEAIQCMSDFWISSQTTRRDFELSKIKYKIPSQFFVQPSRLHVLQQALEAIPHLQLESPEACHLLPSCETVLGDDVYIMTRLNKLCDSMLFSSSSLKLYDRPLTPFSGVFISFEIELLVIDTEKAVPSAQKFFFSTSKFFFTE
jgi:hypothetical protein